MEDQTRFETLRFEACEGIGWLWLSRPDKANAMNTAFWNEFPELLRSIGRRDDVRVVIIAGEGPHFSAGAELDLLEKIVRIGRAPGCPAEAQYQLRESIVHLQQTFDAIEQLRVPVIAAVHGACIGAGLDLIAACDLRYATVDAKFCLKEIDLAVVADVGSLQRLRHLIGLAAVSELAYTAETFDGAAAKQMGLVGRTYPARDELIAGVSQLAATIAAKSAVTVRGVKRNLLYSRDHTVAEGLDYVATWNAWALASDDCLNAIAAMRRLRQTG